MFRAISVCGHVVVITPVGPLGLDRSWDGLFQPFPSSPAVAAFPVLVPGRHPHWSFRGLLNVHSRYDLPARCIAKAIHLSRRLRRFRYLHRRSDSYRLERPSCRMGFAPIEDPRLSTCTTRSDPAKPSCLTPRSLQALTPAKPLNRCSSGASQSRLTEKLTRRAGLSGCAWKRSPTGLGVGTHIKDRAGCRDLLWAAGILIIEVKHGSPTSVKPESYAGWDRYYPIASPLPYASALRASCCYELARNWRFGLELSANPDRPFMLVCLVLRREVVSHLQRGNPVSLMPNPRSLFLVCLM